MYFVKDGTRYLHKIFHIPVLGGALKLWFDSDPKLSLLNVNIHKSTYSWSTLQTQLYSVIKPAVYQKDHQNFSNIFFAILLLQIWCGWLPTKCAICWVLKSVRVKVNNEYYKSYDEPGLRENIFLKSTSLLRYAKIVSRLRSRKSYFKFRFVCFKWTSSLAEDIVKRLLI